MKKKRTPQSKLTIIIRNRVEKPFIRNTKDFTTQPEGDNITLFLFAKSIPNQFIICSLPNPTFGSNS